MTYKLLFNDAVAMTGGQPAEGGPTVPMIAAQLAAEGIKRIAIVADEAERLPPASALPPGVTLHTRDDLDSVQRSLARLRRPVGADLRPGLRHRKAPPPQARLDGAADPARRDQRSGVRELRRLLHAVRLHRDRAGGDRTWPQAPHQPDQLQRRPVMLEGLLPQLRDPGRAARRPRRRYHNGRRARTNSAAALPLPTLPSGTFGVAFSPVSAAAASSPPAPFWRWPRIWRVRR